MFHESCFQHFWSLQDSSQSHWETPKIDLHLFQESQEPGFSRGTTESCAFRACDERGEERVRAVMMAEFDAEQRPRDLVSLCARRAKGNSCFNNYPSHGIL